MKHFELHRILIGFALLSSGIGLFYARYPTAFFYELQREQWPRLLIVMLFILPGTLIGAGIGTPLNREWRGAILGTIAILAIDVVRHFI